MGSRVTITIVAAYRGSSETFAVGSKFDFFGLKNVA